MTTRTADEIRADYVTLMGEPLGSVFNALWQELASVNSNWAEYVTLFGSKPSRVDLLNEAAPHFFRVAQDTLWEAILLHIARLTDSPQPGGKATLTVRRLPDLISDLGLKASINALIEKALVDAEFCRDWRNRHIAHRDLALSLRKSARPLATASRNQVDKVLASLADVLNEVTLHFKDSTTAFDFHGADHGAEQLLYVLHSGVGAQKGRIDRMKNGTATAEDWNTPEL